MKKARGSGPQREGTLARLRAYERAGNHLRADLWSLYAGHRARVSEVVVGWGTAAEALTGGRACVLGAGNANDLDLERLAETFDEVHLVDIDDEALARGRDRQSAGARKRLRLHGGIDLSGILEPLAAGDLDGMAAIEAAVAPASRSIAARLPGPFDVCVSDCLLSQLAAALNRAAPRGPFRPLLEEALMRTHLQALAHLTRPGGRAIVVADLVSSATYPLEGLNGEANVLAAFENAVKIGNNFRCCDPILLRRFARQDALVRVSLGAPVQSPPWLWTALHGVVYLVYALTFPRL